jgi:DNA-binding HxlR family transcriptional regulator
MSNDHNPHTSEELTNALKLLGDVWILCIINNLVTHELRFNEILRAIPGINPATLSVRLKKLEKEKIVERKEETVNKISVTYALTDKGRGILPILREIQFFAEKFL